MLSTLTTFLISATQSTSEGLIWSGLGNIESWLQECTLEDDRTMLRQVRVTYDYRVDNEEEVAAEKWVDKYCKLSL